MNANPRAQQLRDILQTQETIITPCCGEALTAKLIQLAGFPMTFISGFGIAASRLAAPDTGLISFGEMRDQIRNIVSAVDIPCIADGDTGYGNAANVRRTVRDYAELGVACVMIEDQVAPKRCGHTKGKLVVERDEAFQRIRAAVDARNEFTDVLIMGRTDSLELLGMDEAIYRAQKFVELGADITFVEAPRSTAALQRIAAEVPGPKMANMLEGGLTPLLPVTELQEMGFAIAAYPFTLLMQSMAAVQKALQAMKQGTIPEAAMSFDELKNVIGFDDFYDELKRYEQ